ncbi:RAMP superfamily CRISPR-associated protein [Roseospirillum parvum]|uniref:CRISPR/Cas system CSM-associated protein Csm3, group 7 of RAMP superfamily n=1 Tax=Roseospirillum parvum TaxID=83401 RepID=A0A1G8FCB1_9PROT|nr:RAMP superfamily CRISPR-associated protein [Roseospirillum parvum]SDH79629.1 CRISPR/Cas system CSM-associated protein Csm3, group 7 of RAMP superfamily [Roseospirillum parvum]
MTDTQSPRIRRWRIEGTLTTDTPLHLGTGGVESWKELKGREKGEEAKPPKVKAVVVDATGRPCLTPSGLKGAMQAWARAHLPDCLWGAEDEKAPLKARDTLFGAAADPNGEAVGSRLEFLGGRLEFHYAPMEEPTDRAKSPVKLRNTHRNSQVDTGVRIDRASGAALDRHLFFKEVVDPGATFKVTLDLDVPPDAKDGGRDLVTLALALLEGFNPGTGDEVPRLALGAMTGRGHGRFTWARSALKRLSDDDLAEWIGQGAPRTWEAALVDVPEGEATAIHNKATGWRQQAQVHPELICQLRLQFDHHFLLSEPSRVISDKEANKAQGGERTASLMPRVDHAGKPVLPASSIKGVLRARAERILATLTDDEEPFGHRPGRGKQTADTNIRAQGLPSQRLFGAASWRASLGIDPFTLEGEAVTAHQELVAIDRFTGGASGSSKFDIEAFDRPTFTGCLRLDLDPKRTSLEDVGLLVLVLRDLAEGDLTFGYGSTKGYGGAEATLSLKVTGDGGVLDLEGESPKDWIPWARLGASTLAQPLRAAVDALREKHLANGEAA